MTDLFDEWPDKYDRWFETPIGLLVKEYEARLLLEMLRPGPGERILDAGCGTGVFTAFWLAANARAVCLDLSLPMLRRTGKRQEGRPIAIIRGDMRRMPFTGGAFDKTISVTALEFIENAEAAVRELFRVTRPGGRIVAATLNSLSPWARRRKASGSAGHPLFRNVFFRSPDQLRGLSPVQGEVRTAIHFSKDEAPDRARTIESEGRSANLDTGAFVAACWLKP